MPNPRTWLRLLSVLLAACLLSLSISFAATAQEGGGQESGGQVSSEGQTQRLETLLETLRDDGERERFLSQLEALLKAERREEMATAQVEVVPRGLGGQMLFLISQQVDAVGEQVREAVDALAGLPGALAGLAGDLRNPEARATGAEVLGKLALILGLAWLAQWIAVRSLAKTRGRLSQRNGARPLMRAVYLVLRAVLDLVPIAVFAVVAYALLPVVEPRRATQLVALMIINANVLAQIVMVFARALFAPHASGLRLLPMSDETANYATLWTRRLSYVAVYGYFLAEAALLLGLAAGAYSLLLKLVGLAVAAMFIVLILQNRSEVSHFLRGSGDRELRFRALRSRLAEVWHILLIAYVLAVYGVWAMEVAGGFEFLLRATVLSVLLLTLAWALHAAVDRIFARGFHVNEDLRQRYPNLELRANRYIPSLRRLISAVIAVFAILMLLEIWGLGTFAVLGSETGRDVIGSILKILLMVLAALLVWEIVSAWIERVLTEQAADTAAPRQRLQTLLPLLRNVVRVVLVVMVTLIVLAELGLNIGPLLAGAGVIGLAVGFGAQTLVRDVITGAFILVEDTIAVGDWVDLGGNSGEVEAMTIRTVTLRDLSGHVHTIPFGEVTRILNMNRDYGYALIDIRVARREDTDEAFALLQQVTDEMKEDPVYGPRMTGDLEVFGVNNISEYAADLRVRIKTTPMTHFGVRREFLRRTKKLFDKMGVEIPFPHQTIYFGADKEGKAPPARIALEAETLEEAARISAEPEASLKKPETEKDQPGKASKGETR